MKEGDIYTDNTNPAMLIEVRELTTNSVIYTYATSDQRHVVSRLAFLQNFRKLEKKEDNLISLFPTLNHAGGIEYLTACGLYPDFQRKEISGPRVNYITVIEEMPVLLLDTNTFIIVDGALKYPTCEGSRVE